MKYVILYYDNILYYMNQINTVCILGKYFNIQTDMNTRKQTVTTHTSK